MKKSIIVLLSIILFTSCTFKNSHGHISEEGYSYKWVNHEVVQCFNRQTSANGATDTYFINTNFGVYKYYVNKVSKDSLVPTVGANYDSVYLVKCYPCGYQEIEKLYLVKEQE